ncbi:MAG: hypothetical protein ACI888_000103 [Flavobacteriales bacterium]
MASWFSVYLLHLRKRCNAEKNHEPKSVTPNFHWTKPHRNTTPLSTNKAQNLNFGSQIFWIEITPPPD